MNSVINNILTRRSVRRYKQEQISDENLNLILECGKFAPSGMNAQAWHFTVIQNKDKLNQLNSEIIETLSNSPIEQLKKMGTNKNHNFFYHAPTLIIASCDLSKAVSADEDTSVAIENMMLAAHSLNISSCWIHIFKMLRDSENLKNILTEFGVPKNNTVFGSVILGFFDGEELPKAAPRKENTITIIK